ncbi:MAG: hypothetical protein K5978_02245 [Campylobacter sp.]|nr:hypothetical protein [Campylobacter sp.]
MALKIKRRFLLKDDSLIVFLSKNGVNFSYQICENFYLDEKIYKKLDGVYLCEQNFDIVPISKQEYYQAQKHANFTFSKQIYGFKLNNNPVKIEIYDGEFSGTCVLSIDFVDEIFGVYFKPYAFLQEFIKFEITNKKEFNEAYIEQNGLSDEKFDLANAFYVLKNHQISLYFPPNLATKDAIATLCFKLCFEIYALNRSYIQDADTQKFLKIAKKLKTCKILLELFSNAFDEKTILFFINKIQHLTLLISQNENILKALVLLDDIKGSAWMSKLLEHALENANQEAMACINQTDFLKDFELFLSDTSDFFAGPTAKIKIYARIFYELRKELLKAIKIYNKLSEDSENSSFFLALDQSMKVQILFENFYDFLKEQDEIYIFNKKLKKSLSKLYTYENLLDFTQKAGDDSDSEKLKAKIYAKIYKIRHKILKFGKNFKAIGLKHSKNLKISYQKA